MTNAIKLAHVLNKWGQPFIQYFIGGNIEDNPIFQFVQNKIISSGIVSQKWRLMNDISFLMNGVTDRMAIPILNSYISKLDDSIIPAVAHGIVDCAIKTGKLTILEGKIEIEREDLEELKKYLNWNLPIEESEYYEVITGE
jgi:hypothetical protein